jgi:hypothetical protein
LGGGGKAYVLGTKDKFPNWHVYTAKDDGHFFRLVRFLPLKL